jgi:hypothetical protein
MKVKDSAFLKMNVKRFWERWIADPEFRKLFIKNPLFELQKHGLTLSDKFLNKLLKELLDIDFEKAYDALKKLLFHRKINKNFFPTNPIFRTWSIFQIRKNHQDLSKKYLLIPFAIELSKGCSSGCNFCGLSAGPFCKAYEYDSSFWKEILLILKKYCGMYSGRQGICYWATDPYDNPDYEKFIFDFFRIFKKFPVTTTSQFTKNIQRSKNLLKLLDEHGQKSFVRGSILSLNSFNSLHKNFSKLELKDFQVLFHFNNILPIEYSGRARDLKQTKSLIKSKDNGSIACVSGFLINMVEKTIKLIVPCRADDNWPLGYKVLSSKIFTSANDLDRIINEMINIDMIRDLMDFNFLN